MSLSGLVLRYCLEVLLCGEGCFVGCCGYGSFRGVTYLE